MADKNKSGRFDEIKNRIFGFAGKFFAAAGSLKALAEGAADSGGGKAEGYGAGFVHGADRKDKKAGAPWDSRGYIKYAAAYLVKRLIIMLAAYLLGSCSAAFDTYPFGTALLCAVSKDIIFIYGGLLLSCLERGGDASICFFIYTSAVALRCAFSKWANSEPAPHKREKLADKGIGNTEQKKEVLFSEPFALRLVTVVVCSLSVSLARLISDGFLYYDLFGLFVCVLASPLMCFAYYAVTDMKNVSKQLCEICAAAVLFSLVYSVRLYYFLGFSAAVFASFLITLYVSKKFGVLRGTVTGLFAGLACGANLAPLFAVAGFVSGTLYNLSLFGAVGAAVVSGVLYGISQSGFSAVTTLLPELAGAGAVFLPLAYYDIFPKTEMFKSIAYYRSRESEQALINRAMYKDSAESLESISKALDSLSLTIAGLSDRLRRPDVLDIKEICSESFEKYCLKCSLAPVCYGKEAVSTFDVIGKFTAALEKKGRIDIGDVPGYVGEKCFNILKILSEANILYAKRLESLIKNDKTSIFAIDYKAMSKLISEASKVNDAEYTLDRELSSKLMRAVRYMDFGADSVYVYGRRKKRITVTGINLSEVKIGTDEIHRAFENVCGARLTMPSFSIDDEFVTMTMSSEKRLEVLHAGASDKMENSDSNGDSSLFFENGDGKFYCLICDGMGSGREAALTSRMCVMFISKLLGAGCDKSIVIEMLNGFIRSRGTECSAGIDLAELDLISGAGCFVKSGAAPSYIIRGKNLYKLQSKTLPIGILKDTDAEVINFEVRDGDIIAMFSDGVAASLEDGAWLTSLLCFELGDDLDAAAEKILKTASEKNEKCDDMTVGLIRVSKAGSGSARAGYAPKRGNTANTANTDYTDYSDGAEKKKSS